jgi:hypothetical protein
VSTCLTRPDLMPELLKALEGISLLPDIRL